MNGSTHRHRMVAAGIGVLAIGVAVTPALGAFASRPAVVDESSIERAIAGVSLFISENADALATGVTAACPLMTRDEFGWFMAQQHLTPSLDGWSAGLFMYEGVGSGARGLSCGVDIAGHVAGAGDGAPHGVRLEAVVVPDGATFIDLLGVVEGGRVISAGGPEIGGDIGGACFPGEVVVCVLMWSRSGLAITTVLAGPAASVTEARTSALMISMIPSMVQALDRYASEFGPSATVPVTTAAPMTIPEAPLDIPAARATLAEFTASHPVGTNGSEVPGGVVCPSSTAATITDAMSTAGLAPDLDPFLVSVRGSAIAAGLLTVSCGGDVIDALVHATAGVVPAYTPSLTAYDITGIATIDHVLAERPGLVQIGSDLSLIGGDLYGSACDVASGLGTFCVRVWHREGLVVMFEVSGNARPDFDAAATQVITALIPAVVTNLATHAMWPAPTVGLGGAPARYGSRR